MIDGSSSSPEEKGFAQIHLGQVHRAVDAYRRYNPVYPAGDKVRFLEVLERAHHLMTQGDGPGAISWVASQRYALSTDPARALYEGAEVRLAILEGVTLASGGFDSAAAASFREAARLQSEADYDSEYMIFVHRLSLTQRAASLNPQR